MRRTPCALVVALAACAHASPPHAAAPAPIALCAVEAAPLLRLTREEYDATVRDLLLDGSRPASRFPRDEDGPGFPVGANVSPLLADLYQRAAEDLAERAVRERLDALVSCEARDEPCARAFVVRFARRAYRRSPSAEDVERFVALWRTGEGFAGGMRLVLSAILQSPRFLYRIEESSGALGGDERAARLSYFLWGTMPDDALFAAADAGELDTPEGVERHARRMLLHPRARGAVESFAAQWLELDVASAAKDDAVYPEWSAELGAAMERSTLHFVSHVVFDGSGTLGEVLTADYAFADDRLAPIYGLPPPGSFVRIALDPTRRAGVLTQPAVLAMHSRADGSSPILRGRIVRERLFCHPLPPPPDGQVLPPDRDASASPRARYEAHGTNPACVTCHELMDPLGFALESYDGLGRWRDADGSFPVDARGEIRGTRASDGPVDGAVGLARALASSPDVARCFAEQMWRYALRREPDDCAFPRAHEAFVASGLDVRELMIAIARSDAFLHREVAP
jgi:hypothetical protein